MFADVYKIHLSKGFKGHSFRLKPKAAVAMADPETMDAMMVNDAHQPLAKFSKDPRNTSEEECVHIRTAKHIYIHTIPFLGQDIISIVSELDRTLRKQKP